MATKYLVFTIMHADSFRERQGEEHPILRYDVQPFDYRYQAEEFVRNEAMNTSYTLKDFRILAEDIKDPNEPEELI